MTFENDNGTNKLALRILNDAETDAAATKAEASETVARLRAENEEAVAQKRTAYAKARETAVNGVIDGCRTRASIEGRKQTLAQKRAVIDDVFARAYQALLSESAQVRGAVCARMIRTESEGGETVRPAAGDREAITAYTKQNPSLKLSVSSDNAPIDGGFQLVGVGYEKDCSFESLMLELRGAEETAVAKLLFD